MRAWPFIVSVLITAPASAAEPAAPRLYPANIWSMDDLVRMNECQLLDLFRRAEPGPVPCGFAPGVVISKPGSKTTKLNSRIMKPVWQGKYFGSDGIMTNKIASVRFIKGQVSREASWIDGRPSNAIDYSQTSTLFKPFRDEFREVSPGIYLGIMFQRDDCRPKILTWFAIDVRCR